MHTDSDHCQLGLVEFCHYFLQPSLHYYLWLLPNHLHSTHTVCTPLQVHTTNQMLHLPYRLFLYNYKPVFGVKVSCTTTFFPAAHASRTCVKIKLKDVL